MIKNVFCALGLALTLGCATAVVRPYVGEQQAWPTANGSIVSVRYDLPVFTSLPPSPYEVLGELRIQSPLFLQPEEGHLGKLVKKGIEIGAEALVFVDGQIYFSTPYGVRSGDPVAAATTGKKTTVTQVNRFNPESFRRGVNIVAIRWLDESPPGLPSRYARYSAKMLTNEPPAVVEPDEAAEPAAEPAPAAATEPTTNFTAKSAPASAAAPAKPAPPQPEAPAAPATPETPPAESITAPTLTLPATPVVEEPPMQQ